jgi:endogenous inhibitor of DNA gyrase (YacG/DUF329 family)
MATVRCPICGKTFQPEATAAAPFCSPRCKQIDLARWLGENYSLPMDPEREEPESPCDGQSRSDDTH